MLNLLNEPELRAAMVRKGYTQKALADELDMTERTFSRRMKTGIFGSDEISKIVAILDIDDPLFIFFKGLVT